MVIQFLSHSGHIPQPTIAARDLWLPCWTMQVIEQSHPTQKVLLDSTGSERLSGMVSNELSGSDYAIYYIRDQRQRNHFRGGWGGTRSLITDTAECDSANEMLEAVRNSGPESGRNQS